MDNNEQINHAKKISFGIGGKISDFIADAKRIFIVSRKPTWDDFKRMSLIVALGMVLIGIIAYIVYLIFALTAIGY